MPLPAAALIGAGATVAGTAANAISQGNLNKKNRAFAKEMYQTQKQDNLDFWQMQNSYNSPEAQMARLKEAGLNPHLAYGNGSVANTGGSISSPHFSPPDQKAPQIDMPAVVMSYYDVKQRLS